MNNRLKILLLGLVILSGSFLWGLWRGQEEGQRFIANSYFNNKREELGELFYDTKVALDLQGILSAKKDHIWTIKSEDQSIAKDIAMDQDSIYIQTGADSGNISQWKNITSDNFDIGDQVIITIYLASDDTLLNGYWAKKIVK